MKNREWKEYYFTEIFKIYSSSSGIDKNKLILKKGDIPYITRSEKNNGIDLFLCKQNDRYNTDSSNVITIGLDTQTVFYQSREFYTGQNIQILESKHLNKSIAAFLIPLIEIQMEKFNWGGYGATLSRLKRSKILLPTTPKGKPDYAFMETYMREKEQAKIKKYIKYISKRISELKKTKKVISLADKEWKEFFIEDVTEINSGRDIYKIERIKGNTPYVSSTALNNGIGYFVGNENKTLEANCLSVNRNGSVGYSFYHDYPALFSNDCRKLKLKYPSKHVGIFISQQITRQRKKYGYGYKMGTGRLKRQKIMLPINESKEPDYDFMENYMKLLELNKLKKYIEYKKKN
ncbi:MAG: restriction endonuclease subunit S [Alphaproteobacteria bacterium]